tara:strand:- start:156 stop:839 length:684 start_codon:yes stop_codon:yes gene_type:complete
MPTIDIKPSTQDGRIFKSTNDSGGGWATTRNATSGTVSNTATAITNAVSVSLQASRAGGDDHNLSRTFFTFDTSGITTTVSAASLYIYGQSFGAADLFAIRSEHGFILGTGDIDAIYHWVGTTADGLGAGDEESNVTKYSVEITTWNTGAYNTIELTPQARIDIQSVDSFKVCLIESVHDLRDIAPTSYTARSGVRFVESSSSYDPYLRTTYAAAVADNATFFGANF